jgi:glucosamine-6-phosphate deaminase
VLLRAFAVYQPKCYDMLQTIQQMGELPPRNRVVDLYHGLTKTSIDYAILERVRPGDPFRHVFVRAGFDWDDIGTFASLTAKMSANSEGNRCRGNVVARACHDCVLIAEPPIEVRASGLSRIALFANDEGDVLISPSAFAQSERSQVLERCFFERTGYPLNVRINANNARIANGKRGNVIVVDSGSMQIQVEDNLIRVSKEGEPANGLVELEHTHQAIVCADYAAMSELAAAELTSRIRGVLAHKSRAVVALSTGRTPELLYELLRSHYRTALDWTMVAIVEMDDYVGISKKSVQSATHYLRERVMDPLGIQETFPIPNEPDVTDDDLSAFEAQLRRMGGLDVVVHGIGSNGHIGFNEPGSSFSSCSRVVTLAESTIRANSGRFPGMEAVPRRGVTLGLGLLREARVSLLLASGPEKHEAIRRTLCGPVSEAVPATVLKRSPSAIYLLDEDAWMAPKTCRAFSL